MTDKLQDTATTLVDKMVKRTRRDRLILALDILLTIGLLIFGLITNHQANINATTSRALAAQQAQLHAAQLQSCASTNTVRAASAAYQRLFILALIGGKPVPPATQVIVNQLENDITTIYKPVDCNAIFGK